VFRLAVAALACGLVLAGCSTSPPNAQARATAEACGVFQHHYGLKQTEMVAEVGQRSGDAELAREARELERDLPKLDQDIDVPVLVDVARMTDRCQQLGFQPLRAK
jgi:hypothetical protein